MRALFVKEFHQGRPLLVFSLLAALAVALARLAGGRLAPHLAGPGEPSPLSVGVATTLLATPLVVALLAGAGLFAVEADHNTAPVLFALPLSRRRIWLAKLLAGLALTGVGSLVLVGLGRVLLPRTYLLLTATAYLPDLCGALVAVLAVAALASALTSYAVAAVAVSGLLVGATFLAAGLLVTNLGAVLLGYDVMSEIVLWAVLFAPAFLAASALAISRGELLGSLRRHLVALPALAVGLLVTVLAVCGVARMATRYSRNGVREVVEVSLPEGAPVAAVLTRGDAVPYHREGRGGARGGWRRRGDDWEGSQLGDLDQGPLYRSNHLVAVGLEGGRELEVARVGFDDHQFGAAVSPDGRYLAIARGPLGLTWGVQSWREVPPRLRVQDLEAGREVYDGVPRPLRKQPGGHAVPLKWSPRGDWLAFSVTTGGSSWATQVGLYVMRADGGEARKLPVNPEIDQWDWSPQGDAIYAVDRGNLYRVTPDGKTGKPVFRGGPTPGMRTIHWAGLSPDGRWVALYETEQPGRSVGPPASGPADGPEAPAESQPRLMTQALRLVSTDRGSSSAIWSRTYVLPAREGRDQEPREPRPPRLTWTRDSGTLYALLWEDERRVSLHHWRPGQASLAPVGVEGVTQGSRLLAGPKADEVILWPERGWFGATPYGPMVIAAEGGAQPILSRQFAEKNRLLGVGPEGRLITVTGPRTGQRIVATDLESGRSVAIYP